MLRQVIMVAKFLDLNNDREFKTAFKSLKRHLKSAFFDTSARLS